MLLKTNKREAKKSAGAPVVPACIGIIMDGNRRWAHSCGLPQFEGHRRGYAKLLDCADWAIEAGVRHLIVYAFSNENWNRSAEEVSYLMNLFRTLLADFGTKALRKGVRLIFLGERKRFSDDLCSGMSRLEEETKQCATLTLGVALSYGGRTEIVSAIRSLSEEEKNTITEESFSKKLWTRDFPDPDMIIRTSGEERLSGFLPWQSVYSEFFFVTSYWPAFTKKDFFGLLQAYAERTRRRGV